VSRLIIADPSTSPTFYANLWSLQKYFANPATLDGPSVPIEVEVEVEDDSPSNGSGDAASKMKSDKLTNAGQSSSKAGKAKRTRTKLTVETPLETFKRKTELILPVLFAQTAKERAMGGLDMDDAPSAPLGRIVGSDGAGRKRKRGDTSGPSIAGTMTPTGGPKVQGGASSTFFHPRYLTPPNLLAYELADLSFRRQILVQYFILFQFLLLLSPDNKYSQKPHHMGMISKNFVLSQEDQDWAKGKVRAIMAELNGMGRDGRRWCDAVLGIITREKHYVSLCYRRYSGGRSGCFVVARGDDHTATFIAMRSTPAHLPTYTQSRRRSCATRRCHGEHAATPS
jgi:THO complex subunit 1